MKEVNDFLGSLADENSPAYNGDLYAVLPAECTDGVTRVGICELYELTEDDYVYFIGEYDEIIEKAQAISKEKGIEEFDLDIHTTKRFMY